MLLLDRAAASMRRSGIGVRGRGVGSGFHDEVLGLTTSGGLDEAPPTVTMSI